MERSTLLSKNILEPIFSFLYKIFRYLLLIGVSYMAVFPIIKMLSASLSLAEDYFAGVAEYIPPTPTFENFKNVQSYFNYFKSAKVTLLITVTSTIVSVFICSLVGYGLGSSGTVVAAVYDRYAKTPVRDLMRLKDLFLSLQA